MYDNYTQYYTGFYSLQHNSCNYPFDLILAEFPVKYNEIIAYRDRVGRRELKFQPGRQKIMNIFFNYPLRMLFLFIMLSCTHKGFGLMSGARSLWFCNCCTCLFKVYRPRDAKFSDCKGYTGPEICWGNRMSKSDMAHSLQTWCSLLEENVPHNCPSPLNISLSLNELVWLCRVHVAEVETVQCAYIMGLR